MKWMSRPALLACGILAAAVAGGSYLWKDDGRGGASAHPSAPAHADVQRGINLSGGEFGRVPGLINKNYTYPRADEVDYFHDQGFRLFRVPFRWERLQPSPDGVLSAGDVAALRKLVVHILARDAIVVLDLHNYAARSVDGRSMRLGAPGLGAPQLADLWVRLLAGLPRDGRIWIGLMNEPNGIAATDWWPIAQDSVKLLRARGVRNRILVPGTSWTGAHSWISSGNAAQAAKFVDPLNDYAFEVHQYLDRDSSGTKADCSAGAAGRVDAVIAWAKQHRAKLFLGEMAAGDTPQCAIEYPAMLRSAERSGVFIGWAAWGGGSWWSASYPFRLTPLGWPAARAPAPHLTTLRAFMQNRQKR